MGTLAGEEREKNPCGPEFPLSFFRAAAASALENDDFFPLTAPGYCGKRQLLCAYCISIFYGASCVEYRRIWPYRIIMARGVRAAIWLLPEINVA